MSCPCTDQHSIFKETDVATGQYKHLLVPYFFDSMFRMKMKHEITGRVGFEMALGTLVDCRPVSLDRVLQIGLARREQLVAILTFNRIRKF
jgi:hypothetical protein